MPPSHGGSRRFKSYSAHHLPPARDPFSVWFEALEARHLSGLAFSEVRRALQALSALYVERRGRLTSGAALQGAGKRAAFAVYYGALHFLVVREVIRALGVAEPPPRRILDLGCGTGAAGATWALEARGLPLVEGVDRSGWAVAEARWTLAALGLRGRARKGILEGSTLTGRGEALLLAFTANELEEQARGRLLPRILEAARAGSRVLVVEPISRRVSPWWSDWAAAFVEAGGREDAWRFRADLPPTLALLDQATGLDHRELRARSLWLPRRGRESRHR